MRPVAKTRIDAKDLPALEGATLRRIVACISPYWARGALVAACMVVAAAFNLAPPG
ncbi:MAG: hypothetical protein HYX76_05150 [Acidobacteria bacterium]|nr:hypothetical protein [Acidobacteriota bacterium]